VDEDRLTPQLGRLIDAAKAAAATGPRAEGWAALGHDGKVYARTGLAFTLAEVAACGTEAEALAFAVAGQTEETVLPAAGWREGVGDLDPKTPVVLKYLGRWVLVTAGEIPGE